jgi:hypothetical protein
VVADAQGIISVAHSSVGQGNLHMPIVADEASKFHSAQRVHCILGNKKD